MLAGCAEGPAWRKAMFSCNIHDSFMSRLNPEVRLDEHVLRASGRGEEQGTVWLVKIDVELNTIIEFRETEERIVLDTAWRGAMVRIGEIFVPGQRPAKVELLGLVISALGSSQQ